MEKRAASAHKTETKILEALGNVWLEGSLKDITLEHIAERSGVTVRTILRKFGSKEGLFDAALNVDIGGIQSIKDRTIAGDLDSIVDSLLEEYESTGMAGIRTLYLEFEMEQAASILKLARQKHKEWCQRVFEPFLANDNDQKRYEMIGALYVETDINCWKLLRIDLGYSLEETRAIMLKKIEGTLKAYNQL